MTHGNLAKEFHKLLKNVNKISDGQARICTWDDENMGHFDLEITPHGGLYRGGTFIFKVILEDDFPASPPQVLCNTQIYHPNIDPTELLDNNICLNMFEESEWQEGYGVDGIVQGILFLFYEPNIEDPLSPYFDGSTDMEEFEKNVTLSLNGEVVEGVQYNWNLGGKKGNDLEVNEGTKNDNSVVNVETSENVPNKDDFSKTDVGVVAEMVSEMCNIIDKGDCLTTAVEHDDDATPEPQKPTTTKQKESVQATDDIDVVLDHPDVIPLSNDDFSFPCPDVVSMTTDIQQSVNRTLDEGIEGTSCDVTDIKKGGSFLTLRCYDSLLPEMNLVFAVMNNVTRLIKT